MPLFLLAVMSIDFAICLWGREVWWWFNQIQWRDVCACNRRSWVFLTYLWELLGVTESSRVYSPAPIKRKNNHVHARKNTQYVNQSLVVMTHCYPVRSTHCKEYQLSNHVADMRWILWWKSITVHFFVYLSCEFAMNTPGDWTDEHICAEQMFFFQQPFSARLDIKVHSN